MSDSEEAKYRTLLSSLLDSIDEIPFLKPTKSNRNDFSLPYKTLLGKYYCKRVSV